MLEEVRVVRRLTVRPPPAGRRLADFGLSRVLDLNVTHLSTQSFGTVPYMPPELLSQGRMTKAVDVYSFGMLSAHSHEPMRA